MATYTFGAVGATNLAEGTFGYLQNFNEAKTADEATAQNAIGQVAVQNVYNPVTEITCQYVYDSDTTPPEPDDEIVVGTDNFKVMSATKAETNTGYPTLDVTLKRYTGVANGVPATT